MIDQPSSIKEINHHRILNLLRLRPGISRVEIVNQTGLGKGTVSTIVSRFIREGVVREVGKGVQLASVGRPPVKLKLNARVHLAIGIELTGSECIAALTDLYSAPLRVEHCTMPDLSVDAALDVIARTVDQLMDGYDMASLLGVGVGVPGLVDETRQRVIYCENIGWFDVPLGSMLSERISKPVMVMNRPAAGVLGEYWYGIGKGHANLAYIPVGIGIGCGILIGGKLYKGSSGCAGEIGHIIVASDGQGRRCKCGNMGCLETLASLPAIVTQARERVEQDGNSLLAEWTRGVLPSITSQMIIQAAGEGDSLSVEIVQEAAGYLGIAVSTVISLFNPSIVIIDSEMLELGDLFLDPIRETVQRRAFPNALPAVKVVPSSLGRRAVAIGAATLVIDRFFTLTSPLLRTGSEIIAATQSEVMG